MAFASIAEPDITLTDYGLARNPAAEGTQRLGTALHPVCFDHNALYHLVQAVALLMLFAGARGVVLYGG
jgi:hypothetical protein